MTIGSNHLADSGQPLSFVFVHMPGVWGTGTMPHILWSDHRRDAVVNESASTTGLDCPEALEVDHARGAVEQPCGAAARALGGMGRYARERILNV